MAKKSIPIACSLTDAEFRKRREGLLSEIKAGVLETSELRNGFIFCFPKDDSWILKLAEMITLEHECCPFLNFKMTVNSNKDSICLELSGQKGTKEFVSSLFL